MSSDEISTENYRKLFLYSYIFVSHMKGLWSYNQVQSQELTIEIFEIDLWTYPTN